MDQDIHACWAVTGATIRGASHSRHGRPNQDAIAWQKPDDSHAPMIIAVADGHGAPLHFRSHRGSRFAVRTAIAVLGHFARTSKNYIRLTTKRSTAEALAKELVHAWKARVSTDLARRPISRWEIEAVSDRLTVASLERLDENPTVSYGSTLIAALFAQDYVIYVQIGDGDILVIDERGEPTASPLPADPNLLGNQTTSLCSPAAWTHMRICSEKITSETPKCVMLSTDGYANSFQDASGLAQAAADLYEISHEQGMLELAMSLPGWLRATSTAGSGDDITVGLAIRGAG